MSQMSQMSQPSSQFKAVGPTSNHWTELPSWDEFLRKMGKDPSRYLGLTRDVSFILHHLATVAVARDSAPWLRAIKDRAFRRALDQLNLDDGKTRAVAMPEIEAKNGKLAHADFMAASDYYQKPLIVRGWFAGARALKEWSPDGLPKYVGSQEIPCVIRDSKKFNKDRVTMTVKEYCDTVKRGETIYLSGEMALTKPGSPLLPLLELDRFDPETQASLEMSRLYVFGGLSRRTGTAMHCGEYSSVFYCVAGKKRWKMLRPDYNPVMNPIASKFYSRLILADGYEGCEEIEDLERYWSQYSFLPHYVGDIEAGDLIVVPGWWWHHVENLGEEFTIGVDLDTIYHYPNENKLLTYTVRSDLSPIRKRFSPWEKNRLARQGVA
jgi:hypothetical protein